MAWLVETRNVSRGSALNSTICINSIEVKISINCVFRQISLCIEVHHDITPAALIVSLSLCWVSVASSIQFNSVVAPTLWLFTVALICPQHCWDPSVGSPGSFRLCCWSRFHIEMIVFLLGCPCAIHCPLTGFRFCGNRAPLVYSPLCVDGWRNTCPECSFGDKKGNDEADCWLKNKTKKNTD